jgi:hypothetical protein
MDKESRLLTEDGEMLDDYSHLKGWRKNPYTEMLRKEVTIKLDDYIYYYLEELAEKKGIPCEKFIAATLQDYIIHVENLTK